MGSNGAKTVWNNSIISPLYQTNLLHSKFCLIQHTYSSKCTLSKNVPHPLLDMIYFLYIRASESPSSGLPWVILILYGSDVSNYWPAMRASLGQRLNQSMVHPEMRAGNFKARLRNLSPTGEKHRTTWRFCLTLLIKYSCRFSFVGGRRGNSRFMTGMRSLTISSISSRANKLDTCGRKNISQLIRLNLVLQLYNNTQSRQNDIQWKLFLQGRGEDI